MRSHFFVKFEEWNCENADKRKLYTSPYRLRSCFIKHCCVFISNVRFLNVKNVLQEVSLQLVLDILISFLNEYILACLKFALKVCLIPFRILKNLSEIKNRIFVYIYVFIARKYIPITDEFHCFTINVLYTRNDICTFHHCIL